MSCSNKCILGEDCGNFQSIPGDQRHRQQCGLAIDLCAEEQSCGTKPLPDGIWLYLQVDNIRIELNCRTFSRFLRELHCCCQKCCEYGDNVKSKGETQEGNWVFSLHSSSPGSSFFNPTTQAPETKSTLSHQSLVQRLMYFVPPSVFLCLFMTPVSKLSILAPTQEMGNLLTPHLAVHSWWNEFFSLQPLI